ncbi:flagellar hook protein FlgE [Pollutimonas thiosulfatoxidans]|uniref:Flagellar hook protein FlgE n=1 Tax=Pollutimonas thiosulfatoxidans TaxID=2028345 RepID=A0A410G9D9_9BURK|nr:flagellar hook-basal body complex protein [Pollutimonas thiosulfatoxidans]QAA92929.1 flagellar hook protein FlgE [Pollutimonas thiosulfatoxidans]
MGFGQGLSGLNAAAQNLDVIGNNIANSGTVGFKAGTASFADVYASSRVGLGTQVAAINQRFTIGTVSNTGNQFDMAIDGSKGMFRVMDQSGSVLYTRNGQFSPDKDGYLINAQGYRLTGYAEGGTNLVAVRVPTGNIAPSETDIVTTKLNLDANAPLAGGEVVGVTEVFGQVELVGAGGGTYNYTMSGGAFQWTTAAGVPLPPGDPGLPAAGPYTTGSAGSPVVIDATATPSTTNFGVGPNNTAYVAPVTAVPATAFDPAVAGTYTHSLPINVHDSLGNSHQLMQYFAKRPSADPTQSVWDVYYRLGGQPVDDPADGATQLTFDQGGRLVTPTAPEGFLKVTVPGSTPADALDFTIDYANSTQFGGDFTYTFGQDGFATGEYASMAIAADGSIVASYTNGETQSMGALVLVDFANVQGLQPVGGNAWAETSNSGQPILGRPGSNSMARIKGQAVEESNVDMSQELVNMIIAQRTYQANAQTIKTQDQILQTLIQMR